MKLYASEDKNMQNKRKIPKRSGVSGFFFEELISDVDDGAEDYTLFEFLI